MKLFRSYLYNSGYCFTVQESFRFSAEGGYVIRNYVQSIQITGDPGSVVLYKKQH